jgi:ornithine carbamoyltransferase
MSVATAVTRHFLSLRDVSREELLALLESATDLKSGATGRDRPLAGKCLGMIFRKHSTRTRVSFEAGMYQLGGHAIFLPARESHLERGESLADTGRVLSRYVDGLMFRTYGQHEVEELAAHATIPVINGLTDLLHPCQLLADLLTLREEFGSELGRLTVAWVGDGNNMANSWLNAAGILGFELRLAVPEGYEPAADIMARAEAETTVGLTRDPTEAVRGAHVVCTDTWASMGQEAEAKARDAAFRPFQVTDALLRKALPEAVFLHCLPAHRGEEVTAAVLDGPRSRVFDEAENRLHVQKALLLKLMG